MARQAIILHEGSPAPNEQRLGRILDFFGVPWQPVDVSGLENIAERFSGICRIRIDARSRDRAE